MNIKRIIKNIKYSFNIQYSIFDIHYFSSANLNYLYIRIFFKMGVLD